MFTVTPSLTKNQIKNHSVINVLLILKELEHRCKFAADTFIEFLPLIDLDSKHHHCYAVLHINESSLLLLCTAYEMTVN
jgi:hypothetical protein